MTAPDDAFLPSLLLCFDEQFFSFASRRLCFTSQNVYVNVGEVCWVVPLRLVFWMVPGRQFKLLSLSGTQSLPQTVIELCWLGRVIGPLARVSCSTDRVTCQTLEESSGGEWTFVIAKDQVNEERDESSLSARISCFRRMRRIMLQRSMRVKKLKSAGEWRTWCWQVQDSNGSRTQR